MFDVPSLICESPLSLSPGAFCSGHPAARLVPLRVSRQSLHRPLPKLKYLSVSFPHPGVRSVEEELVASQLSPLPWKPESSHSAPEETGPTPHPQASCVPKVPAAPASASVSQGDVCVLGFLVPDRE